MRGPKLRPWLVVGGLPPPKHLKDVARAPGLAMRSPRFQQFAALLQGVTSTNGLFGFVTNDMRQRSLGNFPRVF